MAKPSIQAPPGTRDLYPGELLRRRYIEKLWRDTSIRHGFEEIDGPTFEAAELYAVKSGEGILSEVFQVFSGKDEAEVARIRGGANAPYALRPEFTPTLARMYAAKAGSLPKPTKWFWQQNCFRAEKQQRGRLREFGQWNCDIIGGSETPEDKAHADADALLCCNGLLENAGLDFRDARLYLNHRTYTEGLLMLFGVAEEHWPAWFNLLDRIKKIDRPAYFAAAGLIGQSAPTARRIQRALEKLDSDQDNTITSFIRQREERFRRSMETRTRHLAERCQRINDRIAALQDPAEVLALQAALAKVWDENTAIAHESERHTLQTMRSINHVNHAESYWESLKLQLRGNGKAASFGRDSMIVRGLAYYTGMVFEVHEPSGAERAIAGGGRYDNLIELFGGPPTPAVGFGMGDVVLSLVLQDRGLLPEGDALMDALSRPSASYRPDVFVIAAGQSPEEQEAAAKQVRPLVAKLRRGVESKAYLDNEKRKPWDANRYEAASGGAAPLHARSSSKATKNIGKLLQDAAGQKAKLAVIVENAEEVTIKDLRTNQQDSARTKIADLGRVVAQRLGM